MSPLITLDAVEKSFGNYHALRGISAEIGAGDECRAFIEEAIDRLPPTDAEPLRLSLLADQPPREIGAALDAAQHTRPHFCANPR